MLIVTDDIDFLPTSLHSVFSIFLFSQGGMCAFDNQSEINLYERKRIASLDYHVKFSLTWQPTLLPCSLSPVFCSSCTTWNPRLPLLLEDGAVEAGGQDAPTCQYLTTLCTWRISLLLHEDWLLLDSLKSEDRKVASEWEGTKSLYLLAVWGWC